MRYPVSLGGRLLKVAAAFAVLTLALISCDSGEVPDHSGSIRVTSFFPDGTPAGANISFHEVDPDRPPDQPPRHFQTALVNTGSHTFTGVPPDSYWLFTSPVLVSDSRELVGMPPQKVTVTAGEMSFVETFAGYREVGEWTAVASIEGRDPDDPWAPTHGVVELVRHDLDPLRIGSRHDLVHRVVTRSEVIAIVDEQATEALLAIYAIPDNAEWGFDDPGELTYDFFRSGLQPAASYIVPLHPMGMHNEAYVRLELDPALFFTVRNGIAILAEGKSLDLAALVPYDLELYYVWEEEF